MIFTLEVRSGFVFVFWGFIITGGKRNSGALDFFHPTDRLVIRGIQSITVAGGAWPELYFGIREGRLAKKHYDQTPASYVKNIKMLNQFKRNSILCGKGKTTTTATGWDMIRHANREPLRRDRRGGVRRQPQQPIIRFLICPHGAFRKESEIRCRWCASKIQERKKKENDGRKEIILSL